MLRKVMAAALGFSAVIAAAPASAQIAVELNGARADGEWGAELGAEFVMPIGGGFSLAAGGGVLLYQGDNDRYYLDNNGGSERCRDSTNGQYADDEKCNNVAVKLYGRAEALIAVSPKLTIGGGARFGEEVVPYGTIAVPLAPRMQLKGNAGPDYYAVGIRVGF